MAIPTRYREQVEAECGRRLVVTYNPYETHCLFLFPMDHWRVTRKKVMKLDSSSEPLAWMQRQLVGSAAPTEPDAQWRIQLPQQLRQVAGLDKQVVLMGMGNKFEIWNGEVLAQSRLNYMEKQKRRMEEIPEAEIREASEQIRNLNI